MTRNIVTQSLILLVMLGQIVGKKGMPRVSRLSTNHDRYHQVILEVQNIHNEL
jgi:hypothetical protein